MKDFDFSEFGFDVSPWWIFCDVKVVGSKKTLILNLLELMKQFKQTK